MTIIAEINQRCSVFMRQTNGTVPNVLLFSMEGFNEFANDLRPLRDVLLDRGPKYGVTKWQGMLVVKSPDFPERFDVAYRYGVFE